MCRYIISGIARDAFHMNNFYVIYYIYISYFFVVVFLILWNEWCSHGVYHYGIIEFDNCFYLKVNFCDNLIYLNIRCYNLIFSYDIFYILIVSGEERFSSFQAQG